VVVVSALRAMTISAHTAPDTRHTRCEWCVDLPVLLGMISKTKRGIATAGVMLGMGNMNDSWPVKLLFQDKPKSDLMKFIHEINSENAEQMSYQQPDLTSSSSSTATAATAAAIITQELTPTYQQLNQEQINEHTMKNILILKSLEGLLDERVTAFQKYFDIIQKSKNSYDIFHETNGSLRQALDTLFVFVEQELQQSRQQILLNDLKRLVSEAKVDAHRKANNYLVSYPFSSSISRLLRLLSSHLRLLFFSSFS
jgi:hypothetical protein